MWRPRAAALQSVRPTAVRTPLRHRRATLGPDTAHAAGEDVDAIPAGVRVRRGSESHAAPHGAANMARVALNHGFRFAPPVATLSSPLRGESVACERTRRLRANPAYVGQTRRLRADPSYAGQTHRLRADTSYVGRRADPSYAGRTHRLRADTSYAGQTRCLRAEPLLAGRTVDCGQSRCLRGEPSLALRAREAVLKTRARGH